MKEKEWVTPNKMRFESGHKAFDRQTNCIGRGNVWASTQFSNYIRARTCTESNMKTDYEEGYLRNFDLKPFHGLPIRVRRRVEALTECDSVCLYRFSHWDYGSKSRIVHGYVITGAGDVLLGYFVTGPTRKSENVILEAIRYITLLWGLGNEGNEGKGVGSVTSELV